MYYNCYDHSHIANCRILSRCMSFVVVEGGGGGGGWRSGDTCSMYINCLYIVSCCLLTRPRNSQWLIETGLLHGTDDLTSSLKDEVNTSSTCGRAELTPGQ